MDWKSLPLRIKILTVLSIILIITFLGISIFLYNSKGYLHSMGGDFFLLFIGLIIFLWLIIFQNRFLVHKNMKWLAFIISGIIFLLPLVYTFLFFYFGPEDSSILLYFSLISNPYLMIPFYITMIFSIVSIMDIISTSSYN